MKWGASLIDPRIGAVAVLSRGADPGKGHVGFAVDAAYDHSAELVLDPTAFFIGTGDADDAATVTFPELSGDATGGTRGGRNDERFTSLWLGDVEQPEISG